MNKNFSRTWKRSVQPRKQRKFRHHAPLHIRRKFLSAHLSKELRKKYQKRNIVARKGDTVKIMRGQFKGKSGKIEEIDLKGTKVYVAGIEVAKKDGSKSRYPIHPSNVLLTDVNIDDKKRQQSLKRGSTNVKAS
jgi:large subunit ribosomal protein L24